MNMLMRSAFLQINFAVNTSADFIAPIKSLSISEADKCLGVTGLRRREANGREFFEREIFIPVI